MRTGNASAAAPFGGPPSIRSSSACTRWSSRCMRASTSSASPPARGLRARRPRVPYYSRDLRSSSLPADYSTLDNPPDPPRQVHLPGGGAGVHRLRLRRAAEVPGTPRRPSARRNAARQALRALGQRGRPRFGTPPLRKRTRYDVAVVNVSAESTGHCAPTGAGASTSGCRWIRTPSSIRPRPQRPEAVPLSGTRRSGSSERSGDRHGRRRHPPTPALHGRRASTPSAPQPE